MKTILTLHPGEIYSLENSSWSKSADKINEKWSLSFYTPLRLFLGFIEDYKHIILNVEQELLFLSCSF